MPEDPEVRSFHLRSTRGIQRVAKKQGGQPTGEQRQMLLCIWLDLT